MREVPFTNHGRSPVYVAGRMIAPDETRWVPARDTARAVPSTPIGPPPDPDDPLAEVLAQSVKSLAPQLAEFEDSLLEALAEREEAQPAPRRTLLDGIRAELLRRDMGHDPDHDTGAGA